MSSPVSPDLPVPKIHANRRGLVYPCPVCDAEPENACDFDAVKGRSLTGWEQILEAGAKAVAKWMTAQGLGGTDIHGGDEELARWVLEAAQTPALEAFLEARAEVERLQGALAALLDALDVNCGTATVPQERKAARALCSPGEIPESEGA